MSDVGHGQKKLDDGSVIHAYYYNHDKPTWFIAYQPDPIPDDWNQYSIQVLNGDQVVIDTPDPRATIPVEEITKDAISVVIQHGTYERREAITEEAVHAHQEVEGFDQSPFAPDFGAMSDGELIAWAERNDTHMSLTDLERAYEYVEEGLLDEDRLSTLLNEWIEDM